MNKTKDKKGLTKARTVDGKWKCLICMNKYTEMTVAMRCCKHE